MTASYRLTETAEQDLGEILQYIAARDGVERALHVHGRFVEAFEALAAMPAIGSTRRFLTGEGMRWHVVYGWVVLYEAGASPVTILRVIHGARDLDRFLGSK